MNGATYEKEKFFAPGFIHIEGRLADVEVEEGARARLLCKTSSDPLESSHLYIRWHFNGRELNMTESAGKDSKFVQKSDKNRHALIIRNAQLEDSGQYTCIASLGQFIFGI
nr:hypothetical protein BaRGS_000851 [Batillaria attramentaria]